MIVDFLEGVLSESGEGAGVSAAESDGVMDALEHSQLTQVYLRRLRLGGVGGNRGKKSLWISYRTTLNLCSIKTKAAKI